MRIESSLERRLTRARTQLLLNQPFFGTLCLRLKLAPGPVPTMATDGRRIVYDSSFVNSLKPAELEAVLAHEVLHCALLDITAVEDNAILNCGIRPQTWPSIPY